MIQFEEIKPETIIVKKKVKAKGDGHHGGAWKVAYADFVTAMMAFFMLMWILGATTEDQRKGIADYFRPTLAKQSAGGGANGILRGRSLVDDGGIARASGQSISSMQRDISSIEQSAGATRSADQAAFADIEEALRARLEADPALAGLTELVSFVEVPEGLRIELIDQAEFSMFEVGTATLGSKAAALIDTVSQSLTRVPNPIAIRGHTDARVYERPAQMNNWLLSTARADQTRLAMTAAGIGADRIVRIEGSADRELHVADDPLDERNRRISITLLYRDGTAAGADSVAWQ